MKTIDSKRFYHWFKSLAFIKEVLRQKRIIDDGCVRSNQDANHDAAQTKQPTRPRAKKSAGEMKQQEGKQYADVVRAIELSRYF